MRTHRMTSSLDVDLDALVEQALTEDLRNGPDVTTTATVPDATVGIAAIRARDTGTLAGTLAAIRVFEQVSDRVVISHAVPDGTRVQPGVAVLLVHGELRAILLAERTALNLLCHLSGIATVTARWVEAIAGTRCALRDTRKTLPGMRDLEKAAVRAGGGLNHRFGLGDVALIKDNHVIAAGSITHAVQAVRIHAPNVVCEVEVDTLDQLEEALALRAELVLVDNFTPEQCAQAVQRRDAISATTQLEASGGITLDTARAYAETGVDYLAVGALTHSAPALDLGLDLLEIGATTA